MWYVTDMFYYFYYTLSHLPLRARDHCCCSLFCFVLIDVSLGYCCQRKSISTSIVFTWELFRQCLHRIYNSQKSEKHRYLQKPVEAQRSATLNVVRKVCNSQKLPQTFAEPSRLWPTFVSYLHNPGPHLTRIHSYEIVTFDICLS